jgi:hypothetical protein
MKYLSLTTLGALVFFTIGCGSDAGPNGGSGGTSGTGGTAGMGGSGGIVAAPPLDCDPLTPTYCGFPFPNDYWTVADSSTVTGLRLALPSVIMPTNQGGVQSKPGEGSTGAPFLSTRFRIATM